jgi:hypothetical protein
MPALDSYMQNHVLEPLPSVSGVRTRVSRSINSDAWAEAVADVVNVFDGSMLWGARLQERVVKVGKELVAP